MGPRFFCFLFFILSLFSCSHQGVKERDALKELIQSSSPLKGTEYIESSDFFKKEEHSFLKAAELGRLFHLAEYYEESNLWLNQAISVYREQYTTRVGKKVESFLINDNRDVYYARPYEVSQAFFFMSLNYQLLVSRKTAWRKGAEDKYVLQKLTQEEMVSYRSAIFSTQLAQDAFIKELKDRRWGKSVFKDDLNHKIFGASIHERRGKRADLGVSLQLYKDSFYVLLKHYGGYQVYNKAFKEFKKNYSSFPKLGVEKVVESYWRPTSYAKDIYGFIYRKILELQKKYRPQGLAKAKKAFGGGKVKAVFVPKGQKVAPSGPTKKGSLVDLVFSKGMIPKLMAEKYYFGLGKKGKESEGNLFLAQSILGLTPPSRHYRSSAHSLGAIATAGAIHGAAISYELPMVNQEYDVSPLTLRVFKGKEILQTLPLLLLNSLKASSEEAVAEESALLYPKVGARIATKAMVAVVSAIATYKLMKSQEGMSVFASSAAMLQFAGAMEVIAASEKADLRQWSTLPLAEYYANLRLTPGAYTFEVVGGDKSIWKKDVLVDEKNQLVYGRP